MARMGVVAANMSGLTFNELQDLARHAESAGFEAIFSPEFMNDSLINCQIMAQATSKIKVGTWIANIYLRHAALCAQTAIAIDDTSKGRLILGLGVSHRPIVEGLYQEKMEKPRDFMRNYIGAIRDMAAGKELPGMAMQPRAATNNIPIYIGALALGTVRLSGEIADGVMLYLCPLSRIPTALAAVEKGAAKGSRSIADIDITTGLITCISDDMDAAMETAKQSLMFYGGLPFYNQLFHDSGFEEEAASLLKGDGSGFVSEKMADELCLIGPPARCRERLADFQEAGIQMPIFNPSPVGSESYGDAVRNAIEAFEQ
jgi:5,10-methylenetetrahydromethanopterin reductase